MTNKHARYVSKLPTIGLWTFCASTRQIERTKVLENTPLVWFAFYGIYKVPTEDFNVSMNTKRTGILYTSITTVIGSMTGDEIKVNKLSDRFILQGNFSTRSYRF